MHLDGRLQELESEPFGIFQAFKSLLRSSCFWRGQQAHYGDNIL